MNANNIWPQVEISIKSLLHRPWYNFLNKLLNTKKCICFRRKLDPWNDNMGQAVMFQIQFFNERLNTEKYPDWKKNTKKYTRLAGNFYKILEKTIWVNPFCPWYNFSTKLLKTKVYKSFRWKFASDSWKDNI